ncbi:MAG: thiamine pyrophosphate-dependent dehydrogenase E1 component subunit alpha [Nitrospira sp.]|nr:MAG: thiamine pyrophosphate-dependent dehydrogenase E1 component subunit alpha [Nitrospira sp.]
MLTKSEGLQLYRSLLLIRLTEEAIRSHYHLDEMKTPVHLGIGQEAIPVGVCHCLPKNAVTFGTYRNHALYLALTQETDRFFAELFGKETGLGRGKAGSMHLCAPGQGLMATSAVVATTIPLAVGAALAHAYRKESTPVAVFFGDGAMEEGVFWESLNFASLRSLNILFVCEDNGLAIHTGASDRRGFSSAVRSVQGFRCKTASADGSDLSAVIRATERLRAEMAQSKQPGFLHLTYLRFLEHVGINEDFAVGYRDSPSPEERIARDPVARFTAQLLALGCAQGELDEMRTGVEAQVECSLNRARDARLPADEALYEDLLI